MDINTLTPFVGDALCTLALHLGSHIALRRYLAIAQLIPPPKPAELVDPVGEDVEERPNLFRRICNRAFRNKRLLFNLKCYAIQIPIITLLVWIIPKYGNRQMLDFVWCSLLFVGMVSMLGVSISWLLISNLKVQLQYNTIAKAFIPKVDDDRGSSFFTQRNMTITAVASTVAGLGIASAACGITILHGIYAASFVLALMANAIMPRYKTKSILKLMGLMLVLPIAAVGLILGLVWIAMQIWPDTPSDGSDSKDETPQATPSPWVQSLVLMFTLAYNAIYVSVLVGLSLRFDYIEEFGVPARRVTGPVAIPKRVDETFAQPTYRAAMVAQLVALLVFRFIVRAWDGPQDICNVFGIYFTMPAVMIACTISAKATGRLQRFLNYDEVWVPTEEEADKLRIVEPEKEALLTPGGDANEQ